MSDAENVSRLKMASELQSAWAGLFFAGLQWGKGLAALLIVEVLIKVFFWCHDSWVGDPYPMIVQKAVKALGALPVIVSLTLFTARDVALCGREVWIDSVNRWKRLGMQRSPEAPGDEP